MVQACGANTGVIQSLAPEIAVSNTREAGGRASGVRLSGLVGVDGEDVCKLN